MTSLSNFRVDTSAVREGEWQPLGEEFGTIEVLTRGFTDKYEDARIARQRLAAKNHNGDVNKLSVKVLRRINLQCLIEFCLIDVRGVDGDDGKPLTFEAFCEALQSNAYPDINNACFAAAGRVGKQRAEDLDEAVGNSQRPSDTGSTGDHTED